MSRSFDKKSNTTFLLMLSAWALILLYPLFDFLPALSSNPSHPWRVEFIASVILLSAFGWIYIKKYQLKLETKIVVPFLLFIVWSGFSIFWAKSVFSVSHHTFIWFGYFLLFSVFLLLLEKPLYRQTVLSSFAAVATIISVLCITDLITSNPSDFTLSGGVFRVRYAKYAEILLTVAPLFFAFALQSENRKTVFFSMAFGLLVWLGVICSLSKGAMLSGIFAFGLFFAGSLFFSKNAYRQKIAVVFAVLIIAGVASQISFRGNSEKPTTSDYFAGNANLPFSTTQFRIFTWEVTGQMIKENSLKGVGADNFGINFNDARKNYAQINPTNERLTNADYYFVQRTHNEFLQIFAELGVIGFALFAALLFGFTSVIFRAFRLNGYKFPPILWACIAGMSGFFASSAVSSFSFRVTANGIVFFFVAAIAIRESQKIIKRKKSAEKQFAVFSKPSMAFAFGAICVFFAVSLAANLSNIFVALGERKKETAEAEKYFQKALQLNPENSSAYFSNGLRYYFDKKTETAVPLLEKAIEKGFDVGTAYFYLASAQNAAGNAQAAEKTLAEAVAIFPKSVFLRVRYAVHLKGIGQPDAAHEQFEIARKVDEKQANGWIEYMTNGVRNAALKARAEKNFPEPRDLLPEIAVYAVLDEQATQNLFPDQFARRK